MKDAELARRVTDDGDGNDACILVRKPGRKRQVGIQERRWNNAIKTDIIRPIHIMRGSGDSSVGIATGYELDDRVRFPTVQDFSLPQRPDRL
jgi:hypothetical protein